MNLLGVPLRAAQTALGVVREAVGGSPVRRSSSAGRNRWIEVRGLGGEDGPRVGAAVLVAVRAEAGVSAAGLNIANSRVVVTVSEAGPGAAHLCRVVDDAEAGARATTERTRPVTLPGDDELLVERLLAAAVSAAGIGPAMLGAVLGAGRFGSAVSLPSAFAEYFPLVRNQFERYLGRDATDLSVTVLGTAAGVLTGSPAAVVHQAATRAMRAAEAIDARRSWQRCEPEISAQAIKFADQSGEVPRDVDQFGADGAGVRYADRAAEIGLGAAAFLGVASRNSQTASDAALVATARPVRSITEAFACALGRGLTEHHGALILRPVVLRRLDQIDTVVIDPRILYTDELAVTRVQGVDSADRASAWQAARAALAGGTLAPGWHPLSGISGTGRDGEVLVSAIRDPWASALVTEARRAGTRVVSLDDEGLRSLGQGFDELRPATGGVDQALADTMAELSAGGSRIALITADTGVASTNAHVTVGVWRDGSPPPWDADILLPDLAGVWRVVHALPAARHNVVRGTEMSASASALGAVMLLPSVLGSGPVAGSVMATAALRSGYRRGEQVFDEALPYPEPGHDWHALPVDEVTRLLPRPQSAAAPSGPSLPAGLRPITAAASRSWGLVSDFVGVVREDLADPITTILATGAAATALLGSPLDAAMVGAVQLVNTAISAEQTLHAERVLSGLLAVQEPTARRLTVGRRDAYEEVRADALMPGDVIRVRAGEVIPADARIVTADAAEADESALTGESLPVPKGVDATPGAPLAERACMLYAGTTLVAGRVTAVVTAVGPATQMNRVAAMTTRKARKVGLQAQLSRITDKALPWSLAGGGLVGLLSLLRGTPLHDAVAGGVAIAVAAVPEGLPLVVTLAQSAAARRLTSSSVLIRNARAVEAFARLDVVCFDKTGTLSENRLRVTSVQPVDGVDATRVLAAAVHTVRPTTRQRSDHATDDAVRVAAADAGRLPGGTDARLPFQSDRPYAAALIGTRLSVKGSPEAVTAALADGRSEVMRRIDEMTAAGMRVLVVAERELSADQAAAAVADQGALAALCASGMTPLGVIGMADTARPSARPLLEELQARGIGVRLITGDHPVTAAVVAGSLGLTVSADEVMTGPEWENLTTEERVAATQRRRVFARMAPEHKVQVVQALESADLVTAMVGDGANDAAAIRAATVGVGVVSAGSDPARTAADVLLLDGRIGALVDALDEGTQLWQRVSSAVSMLVGHNIGEVGFALITSLLMGRPALNARQILLINLLTDALPAAALAVSPQTGDQITGERSEAALWRAIWMRGASTATGGTLAWAFGRATGTPQRAATMGLIGLVLTQMGQTLTDSRGRLVVATNVGTLAVMAGVISTPGLSQVFGCRPVGPIGWAQAAAAAGIAGALPKLAPAAAERIAEKVRSVLDLQQARADQDGVDLTQRRGQESHTGGDQRVGPDRAWNLRHVGQANQPGRSSGSYLPRTEDEMWESARSFVADHRDVSKLVREAENFSVQLPVIGRVRIPPPEQVAFYGVLGGLAAAQLIDWPIALVVGLGHAVSARQAPARAPEPVPEPEPEPAPVTKAATKTPAKKAAAKKAPAKKAAAKKTPAKKTPAKKAVAKKAAAKKAPAKKAAAKKATAKKTP